MNRMTAEYTDMPERTPKKSKKVDPPKADRLQITVTVNAHFLARLEALGKAVGRNRSEMVDRAIEDYVERQQAAKAASPQL